MGKLSYRQTKFYFEPSCSGEKKYAHEARLIENVNTLRWETRNPRKAELLRRFADKSAEDRLKRCFITDHAPPEQIIYPDHLEPRSFQLESVWHCLTRSPAYCADEAGLGKTIVAALCINSSPGRALIICPPFLKYNWERELRTWGAGQKTIGVIEDGQTGGRALSKDIVILPDSLLGNEKYREIIARLGFKWVFIDEAHRYKEATTQRTQLLVGGEKKDGATIIDACERVVFLSGTPIPNGRPIELFPLLSQVSGESIGFLTREEYGKRYCGGYKKTHFQGGRPVSTWDFSGSSNLKKLRAQLRSKLMIRHRKADVLKELGPKTRQIIFLKSGRASLAPLEKSLLEDFSLDELMGEDHELGDIARYRREVGESKIDDAAAYLSDLLENSNEKVVVFAHHINVVESLKEKLDSYGALMIRGGLTAKDKAKRVHLFQTKDKYRVIVGNMDAMGTGNTLTKSPRCVIVEPSWVPGINEQAEDRVHRMTQKSNVYCQYLVLKDSLDERMLHSVLAKQEAIDGVM